MMKTEFFILSVLFAGALAQQNTQINVTQVASLSSQSCDTAVIFSLTLIIPPGDLGSNPHNHSGPCVGKVIEGVFLFAVNNDAPRLLRKGDSFSENTGDTHVWSANGSDNVTTIVDVVVVNREGGELVQNVPSYPNPTAASRRQAIANALAAEQAKKNAVTATTTAAPATRATPTRGTRATRAPRNHHNSY